MKSQLDEARAHVRNAARASLLAMRSMVDARIRRIDQKKAAMRPPGAAPAPRVEVERRDEPPEQRPHEIV
ncbi:MAG: hypothetical protein ACYDEB_06145 [Dehalococcoidia bacterium]